MKFRALTNFFAILAPMLLLSEFAHSQEENRKTPRLELAASMPSFELKDLNGTPTRSDSFKNSKVTVVYFYGTECPIAKFYSLHLNQQYLKHRQKGIAIVGINSNQQDSIADIKAYAKTNDLKFPLLKDPGNLVADAFGAERTPEIFVFDQKHQLRYRGQIDDQYHYGLQRPNFENKYLVDAVKAILDGQPVKIKSTEPVGCLIGRVKTSQDDATVNYSKQISRILQNNCVSCHRDGEIAPFSLSEYDEVVGWSEMIREVVNEGRMPPWHANPEHGKFSNDCSLNERDKKLINQWVEAGSPEGDPADLPEPKTFETGWQIGKPDLVIPMDKKPFSVPATGVLEYKYFVVDPGFKEDKWIKAAECRIGNRAVVHHIIVAADSGGLRPHGSVQSEWISAIAPGSPPLVLPEGYAKLIPAGSKIVFQMHYTPNGTAQKDLSKVGFIFADPSEVKKTVGTREIINQSFRIPPGADNHKVTASFRFRRDAQVLSLFPHMHLRGKSFRYTAKYPDGKEEILLDIPRYDFNWQNGYKYATPKEFPMGTVIYCEARFDNSENNLANPDPSKTVRWGDQTFEEMMIGYIDVAWKDQDLKQSK